jgi:hypothetical protein
MANALSPCTFVSLEPELCIAPLLPRVQYWYLQNQNTITVGRIGQRAGRGQDKTTIGLMDL